MIEILTNVPTGAPKAPDNGRLRDVARSHAAGPRVQGSPFSTQDAAVANAAAVAPEVLLAAQQARTSSRPPAFDARLAYAFDRSQQHPENKQQSSFDAPPSDDDGAEIIPFTRSFGRTTGSFDTRGQDTGPLTLDPGDEAAQGIEPPPFRPNDTRGTSSSSTRTVPPRPEGLADFIRANQAYVHAGAADGRAFAASGLDTSAIFFNHNRFDLLV